VSFESAKLPQRGNFAHFLSRSSANELGGYHARSKEDVSKDTDLNGQVSSQRLFAFSNFYGIILLELNTACFNIYRGIQPNNIWNDKGKPLERVGRKVNGPKVKERIYNLLLLRRPDYRNRQWPILSSERIGFLFGGLRMKDKLILVTILFLSVFISLEKAGSSAVTFKGTASWYSENDPGILKTTANMELFDDKQLTCAIWELPFNTILKVTNTENGKIIFVRVNDRGPARRLVEQGRIIDLTKTAFSEISELKKGLIHVEVEII
jgi:rare lipoprotein A